MNAARHPTTTHVRGKDVDLAYFQTDGASNDHILCGDGSDTTNNGRPGQYNDGYFCTTDDNDVPRQVWFTAKLAESPWYRVIGIDQTLAKPFTEEATRCSSRKRSPAASFSAWATARRVAGSFTTTPFT